MKNSTFLGIGRILFGVLGLTAIVVQLINGLQQGHSTVNFFSFFTIESNLFASVLLVVFGIVCLTQSQKQYALLRGAATLYMTMTGVVYVLLLSSISADLQTTIPWVNIVLHYLLPVVVLLDWLIFPPKERITIQRAATWLIFPIVYLIYSLVRGSFVNWYPYPFLNPVDNGWPNVVGMSIVIAIGAVLVMWLLTLRTRRFKVQQSM